MVDTAATPRARDKTLWGLKTSQSLEPGSLARSDASPMQG